MANLLDSLLAARSVMDPDQRTADQEFARGLARSLLGTGAGLADMASMAIPGRPMGASLLSERLDRYMGDPNAPGASAAYSGGGLLGDVAQMVMPAGLLGRGASATKAAASSLVRQAGAILPKRGGGLLDVESKTTFNAVKRALGPNATEMDVRNAIARHNAALPVEKGGLGLGPNNTYLERRKAGDFGNDRTIHETATNPDKPIIGFDPKQFGSSTGADSATMGVFSREMGPLPPDYDVSRGYGALRSSQIPGSAPYSLPLVVRGQRARLDIGADNIRERAFQDYVNQAWDQGAEALKVTFGKERPPEFIAKNPNQLRLPWAAFDPAQRNSGNLLAGVAPYAVPFGLLSGGLLGMPPDDIR